MNELTADIAYLSLIKDGEQLCGDNVELIEHADGSVVLVLADGMGSGVKASILSTLTSKLLSTMMDNRLSVRECVEAVADTLPVCRQRGVAYCTFTIIRLSKDLDAEIIQYDNPHVFLLRGGRFLDLPETCEIIADKKVYFANTRLIEDDVLMGMSDGALHANSEMTLNYDWERPQIIKFMENVYRKNYTAKMLASILLEKCNALYGGLPGDDTTACAVKVRKRAPVSLMFGPPSNKEDDQKIFGEFFTNRGKHIVCGGTTAEIAAKYLGSDIEMCLPDEAAPEIPPISKIDGIDLVTEGVVTISHVINNANNETENPDEYLERAYREDGASLLAQALFDEATDVNLYVGRAVNPAHQNPNLPLNFNFKMRLAEELAEKLKKVGKRVSVKYY